ncbi:LysM peptidoglycan-binding domain-containing protein, partial [Aestuariibius sp. 2305UL40-4]|uniref:LysM peptidoglycan-binding domain-containing protein n=1 Tax=Aestuariibius violaceus TaxID=3234132 RepID=UPI00398F35BD
MTALSPMRMLGCAASLLALTACNEPLDFDLRSIGNGFDTTNSVQTLAPRPEPDNRGVISYPGYQVAIAQRGDTVEELSRRLRVDAREVARFNGLAPNDRLRAGEVVALPTRVAEPSPSTGAIGTGPIQPPSVDVTTLAGDAIDRAAPDTPAPAAAQPQTGFQPTRHRVASGETAFSISRLYNVPIQSLAEWNALGNDFAIREGQILLIPVGAREAPSETTAPGTGSPPPGPPRPSPPPPRGGPGGLGPPPPPPPLFSPPPRFPVKRLRGISRDSV